MDQVPSEIQKIIVSFMDHNTKLNFRATSTHWFKFIDYRDFSFYFTRESDLPAIANRLAQYTAPISLSFNKQYDAFKFDAFAEHFTKLTSLTGLDLPRFHIVSMVEDSGEEYLVLSTLSNLKSLRNPDNRIGTKGYDITNVGKNFSNLTSLQVMRVQLVYGRRIPSMEAAAPIIRQNTNLVELDLTVSKAIVDQHFVDLFTNHSKLTKLSIAADRIDYRAYNAYSVFSNLKELNIGRGGHYAINLPIDEGTVGQLTNLESLYLHSQSPLVNLSRLVNLTKLHVINASGFEDGWSKCFESFSALNKLKHVSLALQECDTKYEFLSAFTALERLSMYRNAYQPKQSLFLHIRSTHLTKLDIESLSELNYSEGHFQSLSNVQKLRLVVAQAIDNTALETLLGSMRHLTKLTYKSKESNGDELAVFEKLSSLRVLEYHYNDDPGNARKIGLAQLTRLEHLTVNDVVELTDLQYCPHLTALHCGTNTNPGNDYKYLTSLPLKSLHLPRLRPDNQLLHAIGQLTNLESLLLTEAEDEHFLQLSRLVNLTKLVVQRSPNFTGATLGPMTALQELDSVLISKPDLSPAQDLNLPYLYKVNRSWVY